MKKIILIIFFLFFILFVSNELLAQCCGAGNPISVNDNVVEKNNLQIGVNYKYSFSNQYYESMKRIKADFPSVLKNSNYNYLSLNLAYGFTKNFYVTADIGYYLGKKEVFKNELFGKPIARGFGDLDLTASYRFILDKKGKIGMLPFLSITFPIGAFDQEWEEIKLPISMQPSSGSFRYRSGFSFYSKLTRKWILKSYNLFEYSQRIKSKNFDYKYGNMLFLSADIEYIPLSYFSFGARLSYEYKGTSERENNQKLYGTAYHLGTFHPYFSFRIKQTSLLAMINIPIFHKVEEIQLVNTFGFRLGVSQTINLSKKKASILYN